MRLTWLCWLCSGVRFVLLIIWRSVTTYLRLAAGGLNQIDDVVPKNQIKTRQNPQKSKIAWSASGLPRVSSPALSIKLCTYLSLSEQSYASIRSTSHFFLYCKLFYSLRTVLPCTLRSSLMRTSYVEDRIEEERDKMKWRHLPLRQKAGLHVRRKHNTQYYRTTRATHYRIPRETCMLYVGFRTQPPAAHNAEKAGRWAKNTYVLDNPFSFVASSSGASWSHNVSEAAGTVLC